MAFVQVDDIKMYYRVFADGHENNLVVPDLKTVIVLHGGPGFDHSIHLPFWSTLSTVGNQIVFIDQRGHGRSGGDDPSTWNLAQWGDDVYSFCNALTLKKPIVGGVSFGGAVAMSYMTRHPEHPGGVILCDSDSHVDRERVFSAFEEKALAAENAKNIEVSEAVSNAKKVRKIAKHAFENPLDLENLEKHFKCVIPLCGQNKYNTERPLDCILKMEIAKKYFNDELFRYDFRSELNTVQCPTLVMSGDKNPVHSYEGACETVKALPKELVQFEYFKDAATPVYDNEPERAFNVMIKFIDYCYSR